MKLFLIVFLLAPCLITVAPPVLGQNLISLRTDSVDIPTDVQPDHTQGYVVQGLWMLLVGFMALRRMNGFDREPPRRKRK